MGGKLYIFISLVLCLWQTQVHAQAVDCAQTGVGRFPTSGDTTCKYYTYCQFSEVTKQFSSLTLACPNALLFNPTTSQCTNNYVCKAANTHSVISNVCNGVDLFVANRNSADCKDYIQCLLINDKFTEFPLICPQGTYFNPVIATCDPSYTCLFTCTAAGRFPAAKTKCKKYIQCVVGKNGAFIQQTYPCPGVTLFSPTVKLCRKPEDVQCQD